MDEDSPDDTDEDIDPAMPDEVLPTGVNVEQDFLRAAKRALREEELDSPAVRRFLLADVDRLSADCSRLRDEVNTLRSLETDVAVLRIQNEALKHEKRQQTVIFGIAAVGAGAAPSYIQASPVGWLFLVLFVAAMIVTGLERFKK